MNKGCLLSIIAFSLFLSMLVSCEEPPKFNPYRSYDPHVIQDIATVQKNDFIQLADGRLMIVDDKRCDPDDRTKCRLTLKSRDDLDHSLPDYTLEYWAPQVQKITRYGDPNWSFLAKKYLDNQ